MSWATFDWDSFNLGFSAATFLALSLRELGEYIRRRNK